MKDDLMPGIIDQTMALSRRLFKTPRHDFPFGRRPPDSDMRAVLTGLEIPLR
jgi:hypothetical protein